MPECARLCIIKDSMEMLGIYTRVIYVMDVEQFIEEATGPIYFVFCRLTPPRCFLHGSRNNNQTNQ
jgi:hypothetical protein